MDRTETVPQPLDTVGRLLTPEGKRDPYPLYEELRANGPLVTAGGARAFVTGYPECARGLREPDLLSTDAAVQERQLPGWHEHSSWRWLTKNMLFSNEPEHDRLRRFFGSAFAARRVAGMRPMVERLADEAVRHVAEQGAGGEIVDLVPEFSFRFPASVIGALLGIPRDDLPGMRAVIGDVTTALDPVSDPRQLERGDRGMDRLAAYVRELVDHRRAAPSEDLTSDFVRARDARGELTEDELVANLMLLVVAASEAPQDLLSSAVCLALEHPGHTGRLRDDPGAAAGFVDETLRFDPAVHMLNRVAARDMDYCGVRIAEGTAVTLMIAAGNRDPLRFPDPAAFDPTRTDNQPLTFSAGAHYCLGAALARMAAEAVLPRLLNQLPELALAGQPTIRDQIVQHGYDRLPVTTVAR